VLATFCLTKSLSCKVVVLIKDAVFFRVFISKVFQDVQRRFCADSNLEKSDPKFPLGRPNHAFGCPSVSKSLEQFKFTSVRTSWQHVRTLFRVWEELGFPSQTCIWEDSCIRPNEVLNKVRCGEELQSSGRQGNTVWTLSLLWKLHAAELQSSGL
jgi:hypothetical protein